MAKFGRKIFGRRKSTFVAGLLLLGALPLLTACGSKKLPVYPVTGEVRFQGKPALGAEVIFHPQGGSEQQKQTRPNGRADEFGKFALTTYELGDGAPAGEYQITITWPGPLPGANPKDKKAALAGPDRLQGRYVDPAKSGLKATVANAANQLPVIELK